MPVPVLMLSMVVVQVDVGVMAAQAILVEALFLVGLLVVEVGTQLTPLATVLVALVGMLELTLLAVVVLLVRLVAVPVVLVRTILLKVAMAVAAVAVRAALLVHPLAVLVVQGASLGAVAVVVVGLMA